MKFSTTIWIMFIFSFFIQYYLMTIISVNNINNFTNNYGKIYMSLIMGLSMILLELSMHDYHYNSLHLKYYIIILFSLSMCIYFYRNQLFINDKQFLRGMIEHHSMAILQSEEILNKTDDYNIAKLAKDIIQNQNDEIRKMKELLNA